MNLFLRLLILKYAKDVCFQSVALFFVIFRAVFCRVSGLFSEGPEYRGFGAVSAGVKKKSKKGLRGFLMCVLSPALFKTKRTEKFADFEPEIVLKII